MSTRPSDAAADRNGDGLAEIECFHAAHQAFGGLHRDAADAAFAEVLRDFGDDIERLGVVEAFAGNAHGVVNQRKVIFFKLDIDDGPDDFDDVPRFLCDS